MEKPNAGPASADVLVEAVQARRTLLRLPSAAGSRAAGRPTYLQPLALM